MEPLEAQEYREKIRLRCLVTELSPILQQRLDSKDHQRVMNLAQDFLGEARVEHSKIELMEETTTIILLNSFPTPVWMSIDPCKDIFHWLKAKLPGCCNIVMKLNMKGAYVIAYRTKLNEKKFLWGSSRGGEAEWIRRRLGQLWPVRYPNKGNPFLFIVRGETYYFLEPDIRM